MFKQDGKHILLVSKDECDKPGTCSLPKGGACSADVDGFANASRDVQEETAINMELVSIANKKAAIMTTRRGPIFFWRATFAGDIIEGEFAPFPF